MIKPYYKDTLITEYLGHILDVLPQMPAESVHCVVTSPPYWGLRDYGLPPQLWDGVCPCDGHEWGEEIENPMSKSGPHGPNSTIGAAAAQHAARQTTQGQFCQKCNAWRGSLGLEPTPELYIQHLVQVFREVRRVLRKDGTVFLNLGDSYYGSGKGLYGDGTSHSTEGVKQRTNVGSINVQHAKPYGTSDKEPEDYRDHGCLCENLCGECREVYQIHRFHNDNVIASKLIASLYEPNHRNKELKTSHLPTLDFSFLENHIFCAIQNYGRFVPLSDEMLHAFQESMPDEFYWQLLVGCWQRGNHEECLFCARSLTADVQESADKKACTCDTSPKTSFSDDHTHINHNADPYLNLTIPYQNVKLKPKDLCGIPWRVALALQADGWWLRRDIIWFKDNPMPESVNGWRWERHRVKVKAGWDKNRPHPSKGNSGKSRMGNIGGVFKAQAKYQDCPGCPKCNPNDGLVLVKGSWRPTSAHEYVFLLTKSDTYFCDADAVREKYTGPINRWGGQTQNSDTRKQRYYRDEMQNLGSTSALRPGADLRPNPAGRNLRSVWTIATQPFPDAHFATFPKKLVGPCIKAGTSEKGCCSECGAPWVRVISEATGGAKGKAWLDHNHDVERGAAKTVSSKGYQAGKTIGWKPSCDCFGLPIPCTVCDPFCGSGRALIVAKKLGRRGIGIDLKAEYLDMPKKELAQERLI